MNAFEDWLDSLGDAEKSEKLAAVFAWVESTFPNLDTAIKWNQPMYSHEGTFIIGFGAFAKNFAVSPESITIERFLPEIEQAGYTHTANLIRVGWGQEVDFRLLEKLIAFNIEDKKGMKTFWRDAKK